MSECGAQFLIRTNEEVAFHGEVTEAERNSAAFLQPAGGQPGPRAWGPASGVSMRAGRRPPGASSGTGQRRVPWCRCAAGAPWEAGVSPGRCGRGRPWMVPGAGPALWGVPLSPRRPVGMCLLAGREGVVGPASAANGTRGRTARVSRTPPAGADPRACSGKFAVGRWARRGGSPGSRHVPGSDSNTRVKTQRRAASGQRSASADRAWLPGSGCATATSPCFRCGP